MATTELIESPASTEPSTVVLPHPVRPRTVSHSELPAGLFRQTVEFLVVLTLGIVVFRTFEAEAYVVPTGSMAPALLGLHRELDCSNCGYRLNLGVDDRGRSGRPICPNCGQGGLDDSTAPIRNGDRLLVHKYLYDLRPPRRWEVAVFQSPIEPSQAYVKRVMGLPGEMIQIREGDLFVDGRIARKSLEQARASRIPVYDNRFIPKDADRFPRWVFRRGRSRWATPSGWKADGSAFVHQPVEGPRDLVDWLDYRHWDPELGRFGSVRDFYEYNGGDVRGENVVKDLMLSAKVRVGPDARELNVRMSRGGDTFFIRFQVDTAGVVQVQRNGRSLSLDDLRGGLRSSPESRPRPQRLEVSIVDRRLIVALDGEPVFAPYDFEEEDRGPGVFASPIGIGLNGGSAEVSELQLFRDIYYTSALFSTPRRPFAVDAPYLLGPDEYFVLGDNSPVSNDSRFWPDKPVVPAKAFVGKPFMVHLPGRMFEVRAFGRSLCWIPDPREIRYIR